MYAPFAVLPSRENVLAETKVITNVPLAAVLPTTPVIVTLVPVVSPCALLVMTIGLAGLVAPVTDPEFRTEAVPVPLVEIGRAHV